MNSLILCINIYNYLTDKIIIEWNVIIEYYLNAQFLIQMIKKSFFSIVLFNLINSL